MIEKVLSNHGTLVNISWWNALDYLKKLPSSIYSTIMGLLNCAGREKITQVAGKKG